VLEWLDAVVIQHATRPTGSYRFIATKDSQAKECPPSIPPANPIWCRGASDSWGGSNLGEQSRCASAMISHFGIAQGAATLKKSYLLASISPIMKKRSRSAREATMATETAPDRQAMFIRLLLAIFGATMLIIGWLRWAS